jgi:hypothetical protein
MKAFAGRDDGGAYGRVGHLRRYQEVAEDSGLVAFKIEDGAAEYLAEERHKKPPPRA